MAKWNDVLDNRKSLDSLWRKKYLDELYEESKRDIIVYYSAFQTKTAPGNYLSINQDDRVSFQSVMEGMENHNENLDLILHTPGGDIQATKMIITALRSKYKHIRVIVPITAMSAGTMMCLAADEILLSHSSNLGPIDPQIALSTINAYVPANEIINVINQAKDDISKNINMQYWAWEINKYPAALVQMSQNAIQQSALLTNKWLTQYMFKKSKIADRTKKADKVQTWFSNYNYHLSHGNHISYYDLKKELPELKVKLLDNDKKLKDLIYSLFNAYDIHIMSNPNIVKMVENQYLIGRVNNYFGGK